MNRWWITDEVKNKYIEEFELDLFNSGLAPHTLKTLLEEEFGYKEISSDDNGWELDLWINLERSDGKMFDSTCEKMTIQGCGQTYSLILVPSEMQ